VVRIFRIWTGVVYLAGIALQTEKIVAFKFPIVLYR
jgi:hypothetical protein